jgi:hypothetical protein
MRGAHERSSAGFLGGALRCLWPVVKAPPKKKKKTDLSVTYEDIGSVE